MVKKLLKHEFIYYFRTFGLFLPIVLVIGVMARVFQNFDNGSVINNIAIASSSTMLFVSCAALLVLATVIGIVRFYKNMYSAEGYLTFTLPVTHTQHIFAKLLVALAFQAIALLTVIAACCIALDGEAFADISYLMEDLFLTFGTANMIGFIIEVFLLLLLSATSNMLLYYACITVGQTAKKNRILKAVGAYFIYYIATQVFSTAVTILFTALSMSNALDGFFEWTATHPTTTAHILLCGAVLIFAVLSALFWVVTQTIMTKKLNLE